MQVASVMPADTVGPAPLDVLGASSADTYSFHSARHCWGTT
jgi:hypothetical protein